MSNLDQHVGEEFAYSFSQTATMTSVAYLRHDGSWLTEEQFSRLQALLPTDTRSKSGVDARRVISGIVHVLKSSGRWVAALHIYGPRQHFFRSHLAAPSR